MHPWGHHTGLPSRLCVSGSLRSGPRLHRNSPAWAHAMRHVRHPVGACVPRPAMHRPPPPNPPLCTALETLRREAFNEEPIAYGPTKPKPNPPPPGYRLKGGGVTLCPPNTPALTLPQKHSHTPTPATTAFPTARNRPPPTRFHIPCDRSTTTLELPRLPPPPPLFKRSPAPPPPLRRCSPPRSRR